MYLLHQQIMYSFTSYDSKLRDCQFYYYDHMYVMINFINNLIKYLLDFLLVNTELTPPENVKRTIFFYEH